MFSIAERLRPYNCPGDNLRVATDMYAAEQLYERCVEEHNHIGAMYRLATILRVSENKHDGRRAMQLFQRCVVEGNHPGAMFDLARMYSDGKFCEQDFVRAVDLYQRAVQLDNDACAMFELAMIYDVGEKDVPRDAVRAINYYQMSIDVGQHLEAMFWLARLLISDVMRPKRDVSRAKRLFIMYVERCEEPMPIIEICNELMYGSSNLPRDAALAACLLQACVQRWDDCDAMIPLAEILLSGAPGVARDAARAIRLCERAASVRWEYSLSTAVLARKIAYGTSQIQANVQLAVYLCQMSIARGNDAAAMLTLSELLLKGAPGVEKDVDCAMNLVDRAFGSDCVKFQMCKIIQLANDMAHGKGGMARNPSFAVLLLEKCMNKKDFKSESTLALADVVLQTKEVLDIERGVQLCRQLVGLESYCEKLEDLAESIAFSDAGNGALVIRLLELFIDSKHGAAAIVTLAEYLITGDLGIAKDSERAVWLCERALEKSRDCSDKVVDIAKQMDSAKSSKRTDSALTIRLLEICVDKSNNAEAIVMLVKLLCSNKANRNTDHVLRLCGKLIDTDVSCDRALHLAEEIGKGTTRVAKNMPLSIRICEMCMEKWDDPCAIETGVEIMCGSTEASDVNRAIRLCERYVNNNICCEIIIRIAQKICTETSHYVRDPSISQRLLNVCISARHDLSAIFLLAQILLQGVRGVACDPARALQLCATCIRHDASYIARLRRVAAQLGRQSGDKKRLHLGIALCELALAHADDARVMVLLAELLIRLGLETERAVNLCEAALRAQRHMCARVVHLARCVAHGARTTPNPSLAVRLCQLCVAIWDDANAVFNLAAMLAATGGAREMQRALRLLRRLLAMNRRYALPILALARCAATGSKWMRYDLDLAVVLSGIALDYGSDELVSCLTESADADATRMRDELDARRCDERVRLADCDRDSVGSN